MVFESAAICAEDDAANAVLCNYNPYFMVGSLCLEIKADSVMVHWTVWSKNQITNFPFSL